MAKKKAAKKVVSRKDKPADILPEMPGQFVVMGLSTKQNAALATAIRKKLGGK